MNAIAQNQLDEIRTDPDLRSKYIKQLFAQNKHNITAMVRKSMGQFDRNILTGEAQQAFMIAANRALDIALETDDGRGKNDPAKWCSWRGLRAVQECMRSVVGRQGRPCYKQRKEARLVYADSFRSNPVYEHADRTDYAESTTSAIIVRQFIDSLTPQERDVLMLYVFGHNEKTKLHCNCTFGAAKHSIRRDVAEATGYSESYVARVLRNLRPRTSMVFGAP